MPNLDSQDNSQDIKSWEFQIESLEKKLKTTETIGEKKKLRNKLLICTKELEKLRFKRDFEKNKDETSLHKEECTYETSYIDWGEAPTGEIFFGRKKEIKHIYNLISSAHEKCRLVALLGMGGIGKTSISVELVKKLEVDFDILIWRSFSDKPYLDELLTELIKIVSNYSLVEIPNLPNKKISVILDLLEKRRCLLIFDNFESILKVGKEVGQYLDGYDNYGEILRRVANTKHSSCLLLTSREKPSDFLTLEGQSFATRSYKLDGLGIQEIKKILKDKKLKGSAKDWNILVKDFYGGNPLALKIVSEYIRELFEASISDFLDRGKLIVGDIRGLLDEQFSRLSDIEQQIMYWLAIEREPIAIIDLYDNLLTIFQESELYDALSALRRRHLIHGNVRGFTLQNFILEYISEKIINKIIFELKNKSYSLLNIICLKKTQSKSYIQRNQIRNIIAPIIEGLLSTLSKKQLEKQIHLILKNLRKTSPKMPGYVTGNVINVLKEVNFDFKSYNFSNLSIWQSDLRDIELPDVNFDNCTFKNTVFADTFGSIPTVSYNYSGNYLAAGTFSGQIRVWDLKNYIQIFSSDAHSDWVSSIIFRPKESILISASSDQTIKLWDTDNWEYIGVLGNHANRIRSIVFDKTRKFLFSASEDKTIKVWDIENRRHLKTLEAHDDRIKTIAISPDNKIFASGGDAGIIKIWDSKNFNCLHTLFNESGWIRSLVFSQDSKHLISADDSGKIKIWDVAKRQCIKELQGGIDKIWSIDIGCDGRLLASGGNDGLIKIWNTTDHQLIKILKGHRSWVRPLSFNSDGTELASGGEDQTIRLWDTESGYCIKKLQGYTKRVFSVLFIPKSNLIAGGLGDHNIHIWDIDSGKIIKTLIGHEDQVWTIAASIKGDYLVSGSDDQSVRLWEIESGKCIFIFEGHTGWIGSVAFSRSGKLIASGSDDNSIILWNKSNGQKLKMIMGHEGRVASLVFSPDDRWLISGSEDGTVKVWNVENGKCVKSLKYHDGLVFSVSICPFGKIFASGSADNTIKIYDFNNHNEIKTLRGHDRQIWSVSISPDGKCIASCSDDKTVRLWNIESGECIKVLEGHKRQVWSISFSTNGNMIASGSEDETIRIWRTDDFSCSKILRGIRPYENMSIKNSEGLTYAQIQTLHLLGSKA